MRAMTKAESQIAAMTPAAKLKDLKRRIGFYKAWAIFRRIFGMAGVSPWIKSLENYLKANNTPSFENFFNGISDKTLFARYKNGRSRGAKIIRFFEQYFSVAALRSPLKSAESGSSNDTDADEVVREMAQGSQPATLPTALVPVRAATEHTASDSSTSLVSGAAEGISPEAKALPAATMAVIKEVTAEEITRQKTLVAERVLESINRQIEALKAEIVQAKNKIRKDSLLPAHILLGEFFDELNPTQSPRIIEATKKMVGEMIDAEVKIQGKDLSKKDVGDIKDKYLGAVSITEKSLEELASYAPAYGGIAYKIEALARYLRVKDNIETRMPVLERQKRQKEIIKADAVEVLNGIARKLGEDLKETKAVILEALKKMFPERADEGLEGIIHGWTYPIEQEGKYGKREAAVKEVEKALNEAEQRAITVNSNWVEGEGVKDLLRDLTYPGREGHLGFFRVLLTAPEVIEILKAEISLQEKVAPFRFGLKGLLNSLKDRKEKECVAHSEEATRKGMNLSYLQFKGNSRDSQREILDNTRLLVKDELLKIRGITSKLSDEEISKWASDIISGAPQEGAEVIKLGQSIYAENAMILTLEAAGIARPELTVSGEKADVADASAGMGGMRP